MRIHKFFAIAIYGLLFDLLSLDIASNFRNEGGDRYASTRSEIYKYIQLMSISKTHNYKPADKNVAKNILSGSITCPRDRNANTFSTINCSTYERIDRADCCVCVITHIVRIGSSKKEKNENNACSVLESFGKCKRTLVRLQNKVSTLYPRRLFARSRAFFKLLYHL